MNRKRHDNVRVLEERALRVTINYRVTTSNRGDASQEKQP